MGWTAQGLNSTASKIFHTHPDQPWGPPNLVLNGYWFSFLGVKQLRHGIDHPSSHSTKVKERVELYLYSPSRTSWLVKMVNYTLTNIYTVSSHRT
jgi:hypothetical protein